MKKIIPILLILLVGCKSYYQIYKFQSINNCKSDSKDFFIHENDSIKIIYSFWSDKGVIAFTIFNKLSKPIYIDWSKSSLITNGKKNNYWNDEVYASSHTNSNDYYSKIYQYNPYLLFQKNGYSFTDSRMSKPERITFIPPKSFVSVCKFTIDYFTYLSSNDLKIENNMIILKRNFNVDSSPLNFRNFLGFSTNENLTDLTYIDDDFFLSSINEFSTKDNISNYAQPNTYYINLKNQRSIGQTQLKEGDKIVIKDGANFILGIITKMSRLTHNYTVSYFDNNGKSKTKYINYSYPINY